MADRALEEEREVNTRVRIIVAFGAIYLIWGTTYLAISRAVVDVPPVFMVAVRGMLAGGVLWIMARCRGCAPVRVGEVWSSLPTAALLFGGGYVLVGWAEQYVPSGPAALLNATTPAWVVLFEWLIGRRSRPKLGFAAALVLGVMGVGLLVGGGSARGMPLLPALALVGASIAWAAGTMRTRMHAHGDPLRDAAVQLLTGGLLLTPVSIVVGEVPAIARGFSTQSLLSLGYLVVAGSVVAYSAYVFLLHHMPASKVASHSYVNPLIAVVAGALIANEGVYVSTIAAAILILVSVFFIVAERPASECRPESVPRSPRPRIAA